MPDPQNPLQSADPSSPDPLPVAHPSKSTEGSAVLPAQAPVDIVPGQPFGRYRIDRQLGEGAMGVVYLAHDTSLDRRIALKVPKIEPGDEEGRARFLREARSAAALRHANICPIHDVGEIDGRQYLTMAYIEGRPLSAFVLPDRPLAQRQAALVVRKLALALAEAHAAGIVHRDLKPANVMIDRKGEPVVMDFGLARAVQESRAGRITQSGMIVGSPAYMAPEQAQDDPTRIGPPCDIYSLGVILFELLTGRVPFEGSLVAVLGALLTQEPPSPKSFRPDLDPTLEAIIRRMMAKRPEDRFTSMKEAAEELRSYLAGGKKAGLASAGHPSDGPASPSTPVDNTVTLPATSLAAMGDAGNRHAGPTTLADLPSGAAVGGRHGGDASQTSIPARSSANRRFWPILVGGTTLALLVVGLVLASRAPNSDPSSEQATSESHGKSEVGRPSKAPTDTTTPSSDPSDPQQQTIISTIGMKLVRIPAGEFQYGSPASDADASKQEFPQHPVRITKDFFLGIHEVTQGEWKAVMETEPWKGKDFVQEGKDYPATYVSWDDAQEFCRKLGRKDGRTYRLPTEAEWEYACRAGTKTRFSFGDDGSSLGSFGWYGGFSNEGNAKDERHARRVGTKNPNPLGLFDMHGNVWEWCSDAYDPKEHGKHAGRMVDDPGGPPGSESSLRVWRGGGWNESPVPCRSASRNGMPRSYRSFHQGFRVASAGSLREPHDPVAEREPGNQHDRSIGEPLPNLNETKDLVLDVVTNSINMKLVRIPAGEYLRGSPDSDKDSRDNEKPQHQVQLTKDFFLGMYEVTQGEWWEVMGSEPWKGQEFAKEGNRYPATYVSWSDAQQFCQRLSQTDGRKYRLPTEAEWEYACRANTSTRFSFGNDVAELGDYAWSGGIGGGGNAKSTNPVGMKRPNKFGLFDMHGNAGEWCSDSFDAKEYAKYAATPAQDPQGPAGAYPQRVRRGGGWSGEPVHCRSATRYSNLPFEVRDYLGFRVAFTAPMRGPNGLAPEQRQNKEHDRSTAGSPPNPDRTKAMVREVVTDSINMKLVPIPAGESLRGASDSDKDSLDHEKPQHWVRITQDFLLGQTEVTQAEWLAVMGTTPSWFAASGEGRETVRELDTADFPVECVSWYDAVEFCVKLSEKEGRPTHYELTQVTRRTEGRISSAMVTIRGGSGYRLPTEAEWEYACRAGKTSPFHSGDVLDGSKSNINGRFNQSPGLGGRDLPRTAKVRSYPANSFGLFDMHGNVWEWCQDAYDATAYSAFASQKAIDPLGPGGIQKERVLRGGSWNNAANNARSSSRLHNEPSVFTKSFGFRVARTLER